MRNQAFDRACMDKSSLTQHQTRRDAAEVSLLKLLTTDEAAAALSIGRRTLQERVSAGEIGCVKIGKAIRFRSQDIEAFIERNHRKAIGWKKEVTK